MINNLPSIYEVVTGAVKKEPKEKTPKSNNKSNKSGSKVSVFDRTAISFAMTTSYLTPWLSIDAWYWTFDECTQPSRQPEPNSRVPKMPPPKDEEDSEGEEGEPQEDHESALCGACGLSYDDFWICCDLCETWFHGKCVKITPAKAEHIKQYKCPSCTGSKKAKAWVWEMWIANDAPRSKEPLTSCKLNLRSRAANRFEYFVRILSA